MKTDAEIHGNIVYKTEWGSLPEAPAPGEDADEDEAADSDD